MRFSGLLRAWRRAVRGLLPNVCAGEFRRAIVKDGLRAAQPFLGERLADSRAVRSHLALEIGPPYGQVVFGSYGCSRWNTEREPRAHQQERGLGGVITTGFGGVTGE